MKICNKTIGIRWFQFQTNQKYFLKSAKCKLVKNTSDPSRIDLGRIFNPNNFDCRFIRIDSDWKFGSDQPELGFIRFEISDLIRWNRIESGSFSSDLNQTRFKPFFRLIRNGSKTNSGMAPNSFNSLRLDFISKLFPGEIIRWNTFLQMKHSTVHSISKKFERTPLCKILMWLFRYKMKNINEWIYKNWS